MSETHRILRVIEYVGTPEFIRDAIDKRSVKGRRDVPGKGYITEAILGETAEVLPLAGTPRRLSGAA